MTPLASTPAWWLAAGCTMLHLLWVGALIGLAALAGRRLLRAAPFQASYLFTLGCLLLLLIAPAPLFLGILHRLEIPPTESGASMVTPLDTEDDLESLMTAGRATPARRPAYSISGNSPTASTIWIGIVQPGVTSVSAGLPWIWGTGAATGLGFLAAGVLGSQRLRRQAKTLRDERPAVLCNRLSDRLGLRRVPVAISGQITSPMLVGILRPTVLLPPTASSWGTDRVEMVLLHELWHVRRRDNLANLLQRLIESLMFFHPVVWRMSRWLRMDRENCCDSAVLHETGAPLAYAELLASMAVDQQDRRRFALAMGEHNLVARIRRVLQHEPPSSHGLATLLVWVILATGTTSAAGALALHPEWAILPLAKASDEQRVVTDDPVGPPSESRANRVELKQSGDPAPPTVSGRIEGVTLRIVDGSGRAVIGARAGLRTKWAINESEWPDPPAPLISDDRGFIRIASNELLKPLADCDPSVPCYVYHEELRLAGALNLQLADWGSTFQVVLQPVARVRFQLIGPEPTEECGPIAWTKGFVRLPGNQISYLGRKTLPELGTFEYLLPPGQYELVATGGTDTVRSTAVFVDDFFMPASGADVDLGLIQLCPAAQPRQSKTDPRTAPADLRTPAGGELSSSSPLSWWRAPRALSE